MKDDIKFKLNRINQEVGVTVKNPKDILPPIAFIYGKPNKKIENGVHQVLKEWKEHQPSEIKHQMKSPFISRNRMIKNSQSVNVIKERMNTLPCGIKSEKQIPIKGIINNDFGNESEIALREYYNDYFKKFDQRHRNTIAYQNKLIKKNKHKQPRSKPKPEIERVRVFAKLDLPQMETYDHIESIVSKELTKFKTYKAKVKSISSKGEGKQCE